MEIINCMTTTPTTEKKNCTGCYIGGGSEPRTDEGMHTHQLSRYPHHNPIENGYTFLKAIAGFPEKFHPDMDLVVRLEDARRVLNESLTSQQDYLRGEIEKIDTACKDEDGECGGCGCIAREEMKKEVLSIFTPKND